jgi:hypothetical protein
MTNAVRAPRTHRARHTVVASDLHQAAPPDGPWMRHRHQGLFPDRHLAALLATRDAAVPARDRELVLSGDVVDFDVPAVHDGRLARDVAPTDEAGALRVAGGTLDDHPGVIDALARLLLRGHRVVSLRGNHDLPLVSALPGARPRAAARASSSRDGRARRSVEEVRR